MIPPLAAALAARPPLQNRVGGAQERVGVIAVFQDGFGFGDEIVPRQGGGPARVTKQPFTAHAGRQRHLAQKPAARLCGRGHGGKGQFLVFQFVTQGRGLVVVGISEELRLVVAKQGDDAPARKRSLRAQPHPQIHHFQALRPLVNHVSDHDEQGISTRPFVVRVYDMGGLQQALEVFEHAVVVADSHDLRIRRHVRYVHDAGIVRIGLRRIERDRSGGRGG